jgi:hypothetical protein
VHLLVISLLSHARKQYGAPGQIRHLSWERVRLLATILTNAIQGVKFNGQSLARAQQVRWLDAKVEPKTGFYIHSPSEKPETVDVVIVSGSTSPEDPEEFTFTHYTHGDQEDDTMEEAARKVGAEYIPINAGDNTFGSLSS